MSALGFLVAGLLASAQPNTADADKKYEIDVSATTKQVKPGDSGMFHMHIKPAKGYKVSTDAPLKIQLASKDLKLHKDKLSVKDAKDSKAKAPEFGVKFGAPSECSASIEVDASFFVCDANICERKKEKISIPVAVRN